MAIAFLSSIFFSVKKIATIVGYFVVLGTALICNFLLNQLLQNTNEVSSVTRSAISIVPSFNLYRGLLYLADEVAWTDQGYTLKNLSDPVVNMGEIYGWFFFHWVVIMLLWIYLEQVVPSSWGVKKHPLFFLKKKEEKKEDVPTEDQLENEAPDIQAERQRVFEAGSESKYGILVRNIRHVFPAADGNPPKVALKGVSFGVEYNSCFGILGHNGAG